MSYMTSADEGKILNSCGQKLIATIHEFYGPNLTISKYTDTRGFFYKYCLWDRDTLQAGEVRVLDENTIEMFDSLACDETGKQGVRYTWSIEMFIEG